ncbi:PREDICTED: uncharacterized protein LOC105458717 [Wasmannia auropunctata]|uniref:uncharacterized protein LOC105458717 n=1 Tax=Wasmannia auropunctata TaxID=64793 RepID=UPI0005EDC2D4|nr:PREDICTED: uncharacterized protein LOC105458717 [Wasmannia auropunctata]
MNPDSPADRNGISFETLRDGASWPIEFNSNNRRTCDAKSTRIRVPASSGSACRSHDIAISLDCAPLHTRITNCNRKFGCEEANKKNTRIRKIKSPSVRLKNTGRFGIIAISRRIPAYMKGPADCSGSPFRHRCSPLSRNGEWCNAIASTLPGRFVYVCM